MQNKEFKKSKLGGYNIDDVNCFMEEVIEAYQDIQNENYTLKDKIKVLNESIQYYRTMESTIQNVLVLADKTAQDTKAAAYEVADQVKKEAEAQAQKATLLAKERVTQIIDESRQDAYELAQKVEQVKGQYEAYKTQFKQLLQSQMNFLDQKESKIESMQKDLTIAFQKIQEDAAEKEKQIAVTSENESHEEDEAFYTKAYIPVDED